MGFFDVMESSQNYYIVQELCDGDLEHLVKKKGGKLSEEEAVKYLTQICNGFVAVVREGIVHRYTTSLNFKRPEASQHHDLQRINENWRLRLCQKESQ